MNVGEGIDEKGVESGEEGPIRTKYEQTLINPLYCILNSQTKQEQSELV